MSYTKRIVTFPSSDGKNTVHAELYIPDGDVRGIVLLSHGMIDYVGRYTALAEYLTGEGFVFAGNDHLGHGETAACPEDYGFFAERDGYKLVINDLYKMNRLVRAEFTGVPAFLLGHSMGSFLARLYTVEHPDSIDGVIIHGTGGKNPLLPLGKAVIGLTCALRGARYRSKLVTGIAFGSYNDHFDKSEGPDAWLTRDISAVASRPTDPHTSYIFTAAGYADLFTMIGECNCKAHFASFPQDMPTLVISGDADPVGNYGKGVRFVYDSLVGAGVKRVTLKTYEGARHELFNETNKDEVFRDIFTWLTEAMAGI